MRNLTFYTVEVGHSTDELEDFHVKMGTAVAIQNFFYVP